MRKLSRGRSQGIALSKVMRGIDNLLDDAQAQKLMKELDHAGAEKCRAKIRALWNSRKNSREQIRHLIDWVRIYENKRSKGIYYGGVFGANRRAERRRSAKANRSIPGRNRSA